MGDLVRVYHLSTQATEVSYPGQLSLAIPPWVGKCVLVTETDPLLLLFESPQHKKMTICTVNKVFKTSLLSAPAW